MPDEIVTRSDHMAITGATIPPDAAHAANHAAQQHVFADYLERKSPNTRRRHTADLEAFRQYLEMCRITVAADFTAVPEAWRNVSHGIVEGFKLWMLQQGYAISTVNARLSTVKIYARLAFKAGVIDSDEHARIHAVSGYALREGRNIDQGRKHTDTPTRKGYKKADSIPIPAALMPALKLAHPDTPQGRRDAVMMTLLLDLGLRAGELAALDVTAVKLKDGLLTFYRPKVHKVQTHRLTADCLKALKAYFKSGDAPPAGRLLRAGTKTGLSHAGMSERAITGRVRHIGQRHGIEGLSAHDCRHSWATRAARRTDGFTLQQAGGWSSPAMPGRYIDQAAISNERVILEE